MSLPENIVLGTGALTWQASERRSDRYGSVYLIDERSNSNTHAPCPSLVDPATAKVLIGKRGQLVAKILRTRQSTHVGDLFRGIFPRTPEVGAEITLGDGSFFIEPAHDGGVVVGLSPQDGRADDWLNPRALYDAHEQTVELYFRPLH